jgi:hypothetical protein
MCRWETRDGEGIDLKTLIITSLAGPCSDRLFFGAEPNYHDGDYLDAQNAAWKLAAEGGSEGQHLEAGRREAEELVRRHAEPIKALARELMQAQWMELSGSQVERLLAAAGVQRAASRELLSPAKRCIWNAAAVSPGHHQTLIRCARWPCSSAVATATLRDGSQHSPQTSTRR